MSQASSPDLHIEHPRLFLLYHELRPAPSTYSYVTSTSTFEEHVTLFCSTKSAGSLYPEVTFDDGHLSNLTEALPVLLTRRLTARFFITAGWTGKKYGFMEPSHLRELHASGQRIGAHGLTHKLLTHCSPGELDQELRVARLTLEGHLGSQVTSMSLPGGRFNRAVLDACWSAGYTHVFTSTPKPEFPPLGPCIGRLNVRGNATAAWLAKLLDPSSGVLRQLERADRVKTAAKRLLGDGTYRRLWSLLNREETEADHYGDAVS